MNTLKEEFSQLISLTQLHLRQEYKKNAWILSDPAAYETLLVFAQKNKERMAQPQPPQTTPAPSMPPFLKQPTRQPHEAKGITNEPRKDNPPQKVSELANPKDNPPQKESELANPKESVQKTAKNEPQKASENNAPPSHAISFEREHLPPPPQDSFDDLQKIVKKVFPNQNIIKEIPDEQAFATSKKPEIVILINDHLSHQHLLFLTNLAKAIRLCLCPVAIIHSNDPCLESLIKSEGIKLLITPSSHEKKGIRTLSLSPIDDYLHHPEKKAALWRTLSEISLP